MREEVRCVDSFAAALRTLHTVETMRVGVRRDQEGFGFDYEKSGDYIVVTGVHTAQSNNIEVGDKILSINDIDGGMINTDDLQSMMDTPGNKTKLIIERLVEPDRL